MVLESYKNSLDYKAKMTRLDKAIEILSERYKICNSIGLVSIEKYYCSFCYRDVETPRFHLFESHKLDNEYYENQSDIEKCSLEKLRRMDKVHGISRIFLEMDDELHP